MDRFRETFKEEAEELLADLERSLLELAESPQNSGLVSRIFRSIHTLKGSGAMFGFDDIAAFAHDVETTLDLVRLGRLSVTPDLINLTLGACDLIRQMTRSKEVSILERENLLKAFRGILHDKPSEISGPSCLAEESGQPQTSGVPKTSEVYTAEDTLSWGKRTCHIHFRPDSGIFNTGISPLLMLTELKGMGDCRIFCKTENIPRLIELDPQQSYMEWNITLTTAESAEAVRDVFIFVDGRCELDIKISESDSEPEASADENPGGKNYGAGIQGPDKTRPAPVIRVRAEKLDTLVDLVGELVTVQASLSSKASIFNDSEMVSIAEAVERLTADLRDTAMSIRMVPISTLFVKFRRLVHDLSQEMGKEVVMTTRGGDTELDKTVIDRLNDPLIHIIRNSIDHGIELPTVRAEFRKPVRGNIHMCAEHAADSVLIRISDDGAGLDRAAIFQKAVERELVPADAELTDKEMFSFIFLPGFSTREEISAVSGRGVGMDVVKNSIENLRGTIEIDSERGQGTVITLKLPLTLAIIDGLLVEVDRSFYVFPLSTVEECMEFSPDDLQMNADRDLIIVRGELVPYIFLRKLFRIQNPAPGVEHIVIIRLNHMRVGFVVDDIIGEHQTVIKTMGRLYKNARMFSGSTILADGSVALILDPYRLFEAAEAEERGEMEEDALWL